MREWFKVISTKHDQLINCLRVRTLPDTLEYKSSIIDLIIDMYT